MRSIARCVLPVLVGPSTAVTLRMRLARSRLIRNCPHDIVPEALQSGAARSRGEGKKVVVSDPPGRTPAPSMQKRDLRLAGRNDLDALGDYGGGAGHGR